MFICFRRDPLNSRLPRSSSIDSMVEAVWSETPVSPSEPLPVPILSEKRSSLRPDKALALVSPSVGRRAKGQRATNGKWNLFVVCLILRQLEKEFYINNNWLKLTSTGEIIYFHPTVLLKDIRNKLRRHFFISLSNNPNTDSIII